MMRAKSKHAKHFLYLVFLWTVSAGQCFAGDINPQIMGIPLKTLFERTINFILRTIGSLALLFLVAAGIFYAASNGNPDSQQKAKRMIIYTLEGLVIILLSYAFIALANRIFVR
jgi:hypothetical protein